MTLELKLVKRALEDPQVSLILSGHLGDETGLRGVLALGCLLDPLHQL